MFELIGFFILALIAGVLVKTVDFIEDDYSNKEHPLKWPLAILYGIIIGYLISQAPFSMLFLGAVISLILMKKVDTLSHKLGYLFILISLLYFGLPEFQFFPLFAFMVFASLDELNKIVFWNKPLWMQEFRPFLDLSTIPFLFIGQWYYLIGILSFDLGYISVASFAKRLYRKK